MMMPQMLEAHSRAQTLSSSLCLSSSLQYHHEVPGGMIKMRLSIRLAAELFFPGGPHLWIDTRVNIMWGDALSWKSEKPCRGRPGTFRSPLVRCMTFISLYWDAPRHAVALNLGSPVIC